MDTIVESALARRAWRRHRAGRITVVAVGLIYGILAETLRPLPLFDHAGGIGTGREALWAAAVACFAVAVRPTSRPIRAVSAGAVVGGAGWRAAALGVSGSAAAWVWVLLVILELSTWVYLLPPPIAPRA